MINFDDVKDVHINENNPNWPQTPDLPYRILIIGGSRSVKQNSLVNLINQPQILIKFFYMIKIHMKGNINC